MGEIIVLIVLGLVVGALGRFVNPGRDPMPIWLTMLLGIASVLIVGMILPEDWDILRFIVAVIVAAVLVTIVGRMWGGRRGGATAV